MSISQGLEREIRLMATSFLGEDREPGLVQLSDLDSLEVFEFVTELERKYEIRFEDEEIDSITNFESLVSLVGDKRAH